MTTEDRAIQLLHRYSPCPLYAHDFVAELRVTRHTAAYALQRLVRDGRARTWIDPNHEHHPRLYALTDAE